MNYSKILLPTFLILTLGTFSQIFGMKSPTITIKNDTEVKAKNVRIKVNVTQGDKKVTGSLHIKDLKPGKEKMLKVFEAVKKGKGTILEQLNKESEEPIVTIVRKIRADFETSDKNLDREYQVKQIEAKIREDMKLQKADGKLKEILGKDEYHRLTAEKRAALNFQQVASTRYKAHSKSSRFTLKKNGGPRYLYSVEPDETSFLENVLTTGRNLLEKITGSSEEVSDYASEED